MSGWTKKRQIMRDYNATAEMYDMRYAEEQVAKIKAVMKHFTIDRNDIVIDAGCGTGLLFDYISEKCQTMIAFDLSKNMLVQASKRRKNVKSNVVDLVQADADHMPFKNGVFNRVFATTILQNSPNCDETLKEIKRVAMREAVFAITGLKSIFKKQDFERLLKNNAFAVLALEHENLKCIVAICVA